MNSITVNFGPGNSATRPVAPGTTVGQLIGDPNLKALLGYPDNVQAVIGGITQPNEAVLAHGDIITLSNRVSCKA